MQKNNNLLIEGKQYLEMFTWLDKFIATFFDLQSGMDTPLIAAKRLCQELQRNDIQSWAARICRLYVTQELSGRSDAYYQRFIKSQDTDLADLHNQISKQYMYYLDEYKKLTNASSEDIQVILSSNPLAMIRNEWLNHYKGINYHKIQNYRFDPKKTMRETWADLHEFEQEYLERAANLITLQEGDQIIKNFGNGFVWMALSRGYCKQEADAMGHCGNIGAASGDRILSLRKFAERIDGVDHYNSVLTFILNKDGYLGEMKGRGNEKPAERYHPYVIELLKMDIIKGIRGGGYLPENNFSIKDLSDTDKDALLDAKPSLGGFSIRLSRLGDSEILRKELAYFLTENVNGFGYRSGRSYKRPTGWVSDRYVVEVWKGISDFVEDIATDELTSNLATDNAFDRWDYNTDKEGVENLIGDLPLQFRILLGKYTEAIMRENADEDEADAFWPHNDSEVTTALKDYDDDNYDVLSNACGDGHRSGAEGEAIEALFKAVKDAISSVSRGSIITTGDDLNWDSVLIQSLSLEECAKLADAISESDDEYEYDSYLKIFWDEEDADSILKVDEPYYGFNGYDEKYAVERAIDEFDFGTMEYDIEQAPARPDFDSLSRDELINIFTDLYSKIPDGYIRKVDIEDESTGRLAVILRGLWMKFYNTKD
jgi:hypothetical protein